MTHGSASKQAEARTRDCLAELARLLPRGRLLSDPAQRAAYSQDALTAYQVRPAAVTLPRTQEQVVEIVRTCARFGVPFVARGSGTSLSGGSLPIADGIVIALSQLDRIVRLDADERLAVVESGVLNLALSTAAAPLGLYYGPDPSSQRICTIGGNVAFNAGGAHCLKYGSTSNHVLAIKAVLPDGEVVELGSDSMESSGPDLVGLFTGSEGLFGIALEITVRLLRKPEHYRTILAAYQSLTAAGEAVASVIAAGLLPGAMEIMDRLAIQAAEAAVHVGYPKGAPAVLIVELDGEEPQVEEEFERLQDIMRASGASEIRVAADEAERALIWKGRKSAFSAVGRLSPDYIVNDGVVPRSRLGEALAEDRAAGSRPGAAGRQRLSCGRRQSPPARPLRRQRAGQPRTSGGSGRRDHGHVHPPRRVDHWRARCGDGEAPVHASHVRPRGHGRPAWPPGRHRPRRAVESRQGLPRMNIEEQIRPTSIEGVQAAVRENQRVLPIGGGSKTALSQPRQGYTPLGLSGLTGVLEYDPDEFVLTALAGTPVAEIAHVLGENGQYLAFDPPLAERGATLGGTVAAGLSGPGRCRHGGVRDFVIGVRFVTASGELVRGRGRVVKNVAGFDLPRLFVGSLGQLGVMVEVSLKVLPEPKAHASLVLARDSVGEAREVISRVSALPLDIGALDVEVGPAGARVLVRLDGLAEALSARMERLRAELGGEVLQGTEEETLWRDAREFAWVPDGWSLTKVPVTPSRIPQLEAQLRDGPSQRRYSGQGQVAWIAMPGWADVLDELLERPGFSGVVVLAPATRCRLGARSGSSFERRIKLSMDPFGRFIEA